MRIISLDTETFRIGPDAIAPRLVCASFAERDGEEVVPTLLGNADKPLVSVLRQLFTDDQVVLVFHNASYDLTVMAMMYPELEPFIWAKLEAGLVTDTMIREMLLNLSTHGHLDAAPLPDGSSLKLSYKLAALVLKYLGVDRSAEKEGDDIWRLRYSELDNLRADQYPTEAADYAKQDAIDTLLVYEAQERAKEAEGSTETEFFQTATSFALRWITIAGMPVDAERLAQIQAMLEAELSTEKLQPLIDAGIMRAPEPARPHSRQLKRVKELLLEWTGNPDEDPVPWREELETAGIKFKEPEPASISRAALTRRILMAHLSKRLGDPVDVFQDKTEEELLARMLDLAIAPKRTEAGGVSADEEVISDLAPFDSALKAYQHRQELQKLVTTEVPRMLWEGQPATRVHFPFEILKETGRTSSRADKLFPSANGQNIDPRIRPAFAAPGSLLLSCDYSTLELVCVAQVTYDLFGYSVHRDKINAGYDLHAFLGAKLAAELSPQFQALLEETGVDYANPDDIYELFLTLKKDDPKFYKHWRKFAKPVGLGFPGGLGPYKLIQLARKTYDVDLIETARELFEESPELFDREHTTVVYYARELFSMDEDCPDWNPTLLGISLATTLREFWFQTYPEMRQYLKEYLQEDEGSEGYSYTSPMGMVRRGCSYPSAANGQAMQTPAAEGFKAAVYQLVRACRLGEFKGRAQVVNEIHDEVILEIFDTAKASEIAMRVKEIMEEAMGLVISDVKVTASPCLMERWYKEAEPVFEGTRLVPWKPKT